MRFVKVAVSFSLLLLLCGCCGTLFGMGDDGVEAWVAVKRLEIRVILDAKVQAGRYTVIDGFAQE